MNTNSFSKAIGLTNSVTIGRIINEEREPSFQILNRIIVTFGNINANWLISGKGEMFLTPGSSKEEGTNSKQLSKSNNNL